MGAELDLAAAASMKDHEVEQEKQAGAAAHNGYPPAAPGYGAPPGAYGAPSPGAPPAGYPGVPPAGYPGAPPAGYPGAPPAGYPGAQVPTYAYGAPPPQQAPQYPQYQTPFEGD